MKKLLFLISIFFLGIWNVFAVAQNELERSQQNVGIITSFFSTDLLLNVIFATIVIVLTFFISKIVSAKLSSYLETHWEWENREELIWVLSRTSNITVLAIWGAITLSILWVDMWIFLAWLWFWIWFTMKIFLSNFISWIIMVTQWTYHNWDLIEIWWKMWKIHRIHSLFTAVKQFDGVIYYVPNIKFLEENVSNYNSNDSRRVDVEVAVDYDTDIVKAKKIILQVISQFPNILLAPEPFIVVSKLDNSSVNLVAKFWIPVDWWEFLKTKSNVTETIHLAFRKAWITIPFPQLTLSNRSDFTIKN